jgi:hypothetical protein
MVTPQSWRNHFLHVHIPAFAVLILAALTACSDQGTTTTPNVLPSRAGLIAALTPDVAAALDASGQFRFQTVAGDGSYPEMSLQQAKTLAELWPVQFGPMVRKSLEKAHGGPIDFHALAPCGRVLYARSAFEPPTAEVPSPQRKPYGPWWLVTLCEAQRPTVSLAISAWATDLTVSDKAIQFPPISGNEIFPVGIPQGHVGEFPIPPEEAVTIATGQTGQRVAGLPVLVMASRTDGPPQAARWRLPLESSTAVNGLRSGRLLVREVFVGNPDLTRDAYAVFVAAPNQPTTVDLPWIPLPTPNEKWAYYRDRIVAGTRTTKVARRANMSTKFELTRLQPEER